MQMVLKTTTTPVDGNATTTTETLNFSYDASGVPLALDYNGTDYYYVTNIQGDIMAILNTSGEPVVQYNYDAWGKLHSFFGSMEDTLGEVNPLTYRGYVYDRDSGYYYLQSRYYDPEMGRFINADAFVSTGTGLLGNNMFAYCNSNPIRFSDPTGHAIWRTYTVVICDGGSGYPTSHNVANTPEEQIVGMVNGQGKLPYSDERIWLGSYEKSGCAFIAIYNAMQLAGKPQSLASIVTEVCRYHGTVCYAAGGFAPWSVESYFSAHGINYTGYFSIDSLNQNISEGSIIVFTIMNDRSDLFKGWHAMTALYTNGDFLIFNYRNDSDNYVRFSSLEEACSKGVFLYGILIR